MRRLRYSVHVEPQKKTKDFAYVITDRKTKEVLTFGGYKSEDSAKRGFERASAYGRLFQSDSIERLW